MTRPGYLRRAVMGLTEVDNGRKVVITRIEGGRHARKKLMDLGMIPGVPVTIIR
ncbi:MAG: FeoA domain-containing protein, partial [Spirochaetaceae bacterium]|nr:FeoA domain-containing protein [Spirochaetaceae bacterium]